MDIEKLREYSKLKNLISELEERVKELQPGIMEELEKVGGKQDTIFGKFTVVNKKSYEYSRKVTDLEEKVKLAKFREVEQGKAKVKETHYLTYKEPKLLALV